MKYRPKNCKRCGGPMQAGGTFTSQAQIDRANAEARRLVRKTSGDNWLAENAYVARNIGDPIPPIIQTGTPTPTRQLPMTLPSGVTIDDVQLSSDQQYGFLHPQTGNWTVVDGPAVYARYGKKNPPLLPSSASSSIASNFKMKGGRIKKMQSAGSVVDESTLQAPQGSTYLDYTPRGYNNVIEEGLSRGIIQGEGFQDFYNQYNQPNPPRNRKLFDPFGTYLAIQQAQVPINFIANQMENNRQDAYMNSQYNTLNTQNPIPVSNFQPNPYSLYAKYGGSLKKYLKDGGIHIDPSKRGTFKAQAARMGMGVQEAARHILANTEDYSPKMVRKANFARNFAK